MTHPANQAEKLLRSEVPNSTAPVAQAFALLAIASALENISSSIDALMIGCITIEIVDGTTTRLVHTPVASERM